MFDFLGRRKPDFRGSGERRKVRGPVTIGFEQLEGRELLSSGLSLTIIPSSQPPLASMPRPIVGSIDPEADGQGMSLTSRMPIQIKVKIHPEPARRRSHFWSLGHRFRLG